MATSNTIPARADMLLSGMDTVMEKPPIKKVLNTQGKHVKSVATTFINAVKLKANESNNAGVSAVSDADELKKFAELRDQGVISQDEFEAKKKQILGL